MKETFGDTKPNIQYISFADIIKNWLAKFACHHKWILYHQIDVVNRKKEIVRIEHTMKCEYCGRFKKLNL